MSQFEGVCQRIWQEIPLFWYARFWDARRALGLQFPRWRAAALEKGGTLKASFRKICFGELF
jgi:hypothetical protein